MIERTIEGRAPRRFPTRTELIGRLAAKGLVADEGDLLDRRLDLVETIMLDWIQSTQTGCGYAAHLAKQRDRAGWISVVMERRLSDEEFRMAVDTVLIPPSPNGEMVMFVFPWVETPEDLADVIGQIGQCTGWSWEDPFSLESYGAHELLVQLRWLLPSGEAESWVLGFAPFEFMPFTRRAPYAAIVMRPLDPPDWQERPGNDLTPVHLAQVPHYFGNRGKMHGEVWTETERQRAELLGDELTHVAKAHVSFALPVELEERARPVRKSR